MSKTRDEIAAEFDRIAELTGASRDHNERHHGWLLRRLPARIGEALDVGCGTGAFARLLARRCDRVTGIDLSPRMIDEARRVSRGVANLRFELADLASWPLPEASLDCIASIATLHHLPFEPTLAQLARALRPGGTLLVHDLRDASAAADLPGNLLAVAVSGAERLWQTGRLRDPEAVRRAWDDHARDEVYERVTDVRAVCARLLPGARVTKHLLWRYSIVWRRPV